jgi:CRP/FNR family transcriptional regulator, cyclic AMP receptor protein
MLDRFTHPIDGKRRLIDALLGQQLIAGNDEIANAMADIIRLEEHVGDSILIKEGATDNHMVLIVAGSVRVEVEERQLAVRRSGQHIGEMALIDVTATRAATVTTREPSIVGVISEPDFTRLANQFPILWRRLAIELAGRLRQRNAHVPVRNERPMLFIGSSSEALADADAIKKRLKHAPIDIKLWTDGVFKPSHGTMESLEAAIPTADFAALLLTPHDLVEIHGKTLFQPRDNVVFELGLAMGALNRKRALMIVPLGVDIRLPTDLDGLTLIKFDPKADVLVRFKSVCDEILKSITGLGTK